MMLVHLPTSSTPPKALHVYWLILSFQYYEHQPLLLPTNGVTLADAKHIGVYSYLLCSTLLMTLQIKSCGPLSLWQASQACI
jgi:hypothetical protein